MCPCPLRLGTDNRADVGRHWLKNLCHVIISVLFCLCRKEGKEGRKKERVLATQRKLQGNTKELHTQAENCRAQGSLPIARIKMADLGELADWQRKTSFCNQAP